MVIRRARTKCVFSECVVALHVSIFIKPKFLKTENMKEQPFNGFQETVTVKLYLRFAKEDKCNSSEECLSHSHQYAFLLHFLWRKQGHNFCNSPPVKAV